MAEHQPTVYRIFCLALGQTIPFSISTWSNATVDDLKAAINAKQKLVEIEKADDLALYLINIPYDENLEEKVNGLLNVEPVPDELEGTKELNDPFPKAPPKGIVHILVNAPESGK